MSNRRLSVWAFAFDRTVSHFDPEDAQFFTNKLPPESPIVKVTTPRAQNQNLHAQDGVFSLCLQQLKNRMSVTIDRSSLEDSLQDILTEHGMVSDVGTLFYSVTLQWRKARHLLWRLAQEGISQATVYPGYGGVVGAMEEESGY